MANIKRQCPVCSEKDTTFHSDTTGGDRIEKQGTVYYCLSCGYDGSQAVWIVENQ